MNEEGAEPPRPRAMKGRAPSWSPNAVREMLRNEFYRGERIYNRSEWRTIHGETSASGRRKRRRIERPESEWKREHREEWRIIPETLWAGVQAEIERRLGGLRSYNGRSVPRSERAGTRGRHVFAGLLACGECGGPFCASQQGGRFGCSWRRDRGPTTCASDLRVPEALLRDRIFGAMREQILSDQTVDFVVERAVELMRERQRTGALVERRQRLGEVSREIERLVALAGSVDGLEEIASRLRALKGERDRLRAEVEAAEARVDDGNRRTRLDVDGERASTSHSGGGASHGVAMGHG